MTFTPTTRRSRRPGVQGGVNLPVTRWLSITPGPLPVPLSGPKPVWPRESIFSAWLNMMKWVKSFLSSSGSNPQPPPHRWRSPQAVPAKHPPRTHRLRAHRWYWAHHRGRPRSRRRHCAWSAQRHHWNWLSKRPPIPRHPPTKPSARNRPVTCRIWDRSLRKLECPVTCRIWDRSLRKLKSRGICPIWARSPPQVMSPVTCQPWDRSLRKLTMSATCPIWIRQLPPSPSISWRRFHHCSRS